MARATRELPLVIVACCREYVVSGQHAVPRCLHCEETPRFVRDTNWWLELDEPSA